MKFQFALYLVVLLSLSHGGAFAKGQEPTFFATPWVSKCQETPPSKEKVCVLEKYLFEDKNQRNRIGGIGIRTSNQNANTVITIISPLGIALAPGVDIAVGGEKLKAQPFIFCDSGGCVSQFTADERVLTLLSNKKEMLLTYQLLNGNKIAINIDLDNFKKLYDGIKQ